MAGPQGEQVYSLAGAKHVYRVIVETIHEAALTVDPEGTILFCNQRFCDLMKTSIQGALGHKVTAFVARPQQLGLRRLLAEACLGPLQRHLLLRATDGTPVPVQLSASPLETGDSPSICLVASDLTELEALEKSRTLSHDLSPAVLHMNDLAEVLRWLARQVRAQHGLTVHVDVLGEMILPSEPLTIFLFRAAREALLNVVKHACVPEATICVRRIRGHICLCIADQGQGFDPRELKKANGFGLLNIRERVELLGGRMRIRSFDGRGTAVQIVVPDGPSPDRESEIQTSKFA